MAGIAAGPFVTLVIISSLLSAVYGAQYLGKFIGKLSELHHGVSGEVYAVDGRTLYIKDFTYDGQGPTAYFYANTGRSADHTGFRLRDENGSPEVIRRYRKEGITLTLPEGKTLNNIKIFYVWCEEFAVNFGDVKIPRSFDHPRPQKIEALKGVHAISSDNIVIVDAQTLLIPHLSYDGEAPDAKFWVGRGPKPSPQGIRVPDENGKEIPLRRYDRKTVVLTLPGDLTIFDIGHFGIWCEAFTVDFGHVQIPQTLNVPPSLKMLGVSPQKRTQNLLNDYTSSSTSSSSARKKQRISGLVGGQQLEVTTFRPRAFLLNRNNNNQQNFNLLQQQQQQLLHQQQQQLQQFPLIQQQHHQHPQQQFYQQQPQQQQLIQQRIDNNLYNNYNLNQQQQRLLQEQIAYNQFLHNRRLLEEQQIKAQLNRQHNRFALNNPNAYVPFVG